MDVSAHQSRRPTDLADIHTNRAISGVVTSTATPSGGQRPETQATSGKDGARAEQGGTKAAGYGYEELDDQHPHDARNSPGRLRLERSGSVRRRRCSPRRPPDVAANSRARAGHHLRADPRLGQSMSRNPTRLVGSVHYASTIPRG